MNRRGWVRAVVGVLTLMTVVACSHTVGGTAQRVTRNDGVGRGYGYADDRCGLLQDSSIQQIVGADQLIRPYSGAVCQFVLLRHAGVIDLTYSWFETGSLERERTLAQANKAQIRDIVVERRQAFIARRSVTGNACSVTAATSPGVASWWAQIRGDVAIDPCQLAQKLLSTTLLSDM